MTATARTVEVRGLTQTHPGTAGEPTTALQDVSFSVGEGEFLAVIGPSGCGKSTLLNVLAGLLQPTAGEVLLDGAGAPVLGRCAHLPQRDLLMPWRRTLDNVTVGLEAQGRRRADARALARKHLATFGLEGFDRHWPRQLSGGMRQRAALLRTFLLGRDVLLLDEPFGALDALTRLQLQQWLREQCRAEGKTTILVTHDIDEAIALADRICVLSPRPGSVIAMVSVALPDERSPEVRLLPEFAAHRAQLLRTLTAETWPA